MFNGFIAFIIGVLVIIAPILNGRNAQAMGTFRASFYNYLFAVFSTGILIGLSTRLPGIMGYSSVLKPVPPIAYVGGVIGCLVILLMNRFTVRIQAFYVVILPFLGQMGTGFIIDAAFGMAPTHTDWLGASVILLGLFIYARPNPKLRLF